VSDSEGKGAGLSKDDRESIALAEKRAMIVIDTKRSGWFREDSFRPYSGRIELDTTRCIADLNEFALSIFKTAAEISVRHANSIHELESSLGQHLQSIVGQVRSFAHGIPAEIRLDFEVEVPDRVQDALQAELNATLLRFLDDESKTLANEGRVGLSFWESLHHGFIQLQGECAINPPLLPAGQLSAIWESQPEPGRWRLNYRSGNDGRGVAKRFQWHAQSAAARLGFKGDGDAAVAHWLDQIKRDAPRSHVRRLVGGGSLESIELLDICGLSADYCRKCEADETRLTLNAPDHPVQNVRQIKTSPPGPVHDGQGNAAAPTIEAHAAAGGEAGRAGYSPERPIHLKAHSFVYQYPPDFPDAEQLEIERARLEANRDFENREVRSFDDYSAAHLAWFWHVVSAAATAIGRAGASLQWGANRRRDLLLDFGLKAAQGADIAGRDGHRFRRLCESPEWRVLDDRLLKPAADEVALATAEQRVVQTVRRKARGRPTEISDELKKKALQVKGGKERAKILYQTRYPTVQQVKNVPAILKHYNRKRQPKAE
jgi:hypothetical protein